MHRVDFTYHFLLLFQLWKTISTKNIQLKVSGEIIISISRVVNNSLETKQCERKRMAVYFNNATQIGYRSRQNTTLKDFINSLTIKMSTDINSRVCVCVCVCCACACALMTWQFLKLNQFAGSKKNIERGKKRTKVDEQINGN